MRFVKLNLLLFVLLGWGFPFGQLKADYSIGIYYYPGWKDGVFIKQPKPWEAIQLYPEREPLLGWYQEGDVNVVKKQLQWMHEGGIDFLIYDWYWGDGRIKLDHAINAYLSLQSHNGVKFSLMWANSEGQSFSRNQFDLILNYWLKIYFKNSDYYKIDSKPVVFVLSPNKLSESAKKIGTTSKSLLIEARQKAISNGFAGIYFVGASHADGILIEERIKDGYDALSAYNYHYGLSGNRDNIKYSENYSELIEDYQETWSWILKNVNVTYFVPITSGWDRRPWGGSTPPSHDNSFGTPELFEKHLVDAKKIIDSYPESTRKTLVVCCWNEYGEGSYVEPTKRYGFEFLKIIKKVFKSEQTHLPAS